MPLIATLAPAEELQAQAFAMLRGWLCDPGRVAARASDPKGPPLAGARGYTTAVFTAAIEKSQADLRGIVPRYLNIRYRGFDQFGNEIDREVSGFHARVVQHECDHLDGLLYPMKMTDLTTFGYTDVIFPDQTLP